VLVDRLPGFNGTLGETANGGAPNTLDPVCEGAVLEATGKALG